jgi:hypothetical protein
MKKLLLALSALMLSSLASFGQFAYHDISPDTTVSTWDAFAIHPAALGTGQIYIWWHPSPEVVVNTFGNVEILFTGSLPAKLNLSDSIAAGSGTWKAANYDALNSGGTGAWQSNATDKFLAFRYQNTGGYNYGWLKMSVAAGASSFTVKEYGYNTQPGKSIKAGQTAPTDASGQAGRSDVSVAVAGRMIKLVASDSKQRFRLKVMDMNGRIIREAQMVANATMDLGDISAGTYVAQVEADGYARGFRVGVQ